jgi:hypothetical protein
MEDMHAIDGEGNAFGGHVVDGGLPSISAALDEREVRVVIKEFIEGSEGLAEGMKLEVGRGEDKDFVQVLEGKDGVCRLLR